MPNAHLPSLLCRINAVGRSELLLKAGGANALQDFDNAVKLKKYALFSVNPDSVQFRCVPFKNGAYWALLAYVKHGRKKCTYIGPIYDAGGQKQPNMVVGYDLKLKLQEKKRRGRKMRTYSCPCCSAPLHIKKGKGIVSA